MYKKYIYKCIYRVQHIPNPGAKYTQPQCNIYLTPVQNTPNIHHPGAIYTQPDAGYTEYGGAK